MAKEAQISADGAPAPVTPCHVRVGGFSLIELAVVIVVVALLLGSVMIPIATQVDNRRYSETQQQLEHTREALIGFALAKRYLPCPAISASDGHEDRDPVTKGCKSVASNPKRVGFLPWVTLGVTPHDAWGNLFRYSVDPDFARSDPDFFFALDSTGDIQIKASPTVDLTNDEIPASVLSHGKNGFGATSSAGIARFTPGTWSGHEKVNATDFDEVYVRVRTENTAAPGGEYDDIVVWVSLNQLFARMVSAGRLP
ncbi:MAG: prepilin-type cleavage/methylation domain-containing protein [Verrucomicrobia bacterium]|nr:prepilin-type cleavage/methylation domain-containing protein [Verrucomicrobiota bacterium]